MEGEDTAKEEETPAEEGQESPVDRDQGETGKEETVEKEAEKSPEELVAEANDKYLRLYSDFENFRRRNAKERLELIGSASQEVVSNMLPILDDFERAMASNEKVEDIKAVKEGFELLFNKMKGILTQKGLQEMNSKEKEFDLDLHEAVTRIPAPSKKMKGKIVDVIEKGYLLNDKVIRYAKVVVGE